MKVTELTSWYDSLPLWVKILVQVIGGAVIGGIYRILKFVENKNIVTLVAGILVLVTGIGNAIAWVVDLVTQILYGKITILAD